MKKPRIGQILVAEGMLSDMDVARALGFQRSSMEAYRLGSILLNWELIAEESLLAALAKFHNCPFVTWGVLSQASPGALQSLTSKQAVRLGAVPYAIESGGLRVAFRNPSDLAAVDDVSRIARKRVLATVTTEVRLALAQQRFYGHPMPHQFRQILQKLDRRRSASARVKEAGGAGEVLVAAPGDFGGGPGSAARPGASEMVAAPLPRAIAGPEEAVEGISASEIQEYAGAAKNAPPESPQARTRDEIAESVLEALLAQFPRVIVLGVGRSAITGWTGGGLGLSREMVAAIQVPRTERNVLAEVAESGVPHFGPVEPGRFPPALHAVLGTESLECAVFPVRVLDTVVGLLYSDRLGDPILYGDFAKLARGAATAASRLSHFLLRREGSKAI